MEKAIKGALPESGHNREYGTVAKGYNMKILLTLIFFVVACASGIRPIEIAQMNRTSLMKIQIGMNKEQVLEIMGTKTYNENSIASTVTNPHKIEAMTIPDGIIEAVFYYTETKLSDNVTRDNELTPLIFINNKLVGWGWSFYQDTTKKYDIDIEIKGETP